MMDSSTNGGTVALTIKGIPPEVKNRLRMQAAKNGRPMSEEIRHLLDIGTSNNNETQKLRGALIEINALSSQFLK